MTCAAMVETLRVERRCWWGFDGAKLGDRHERFLRKVDPLNALIQFRISWTMPNGYVRDDEKMFLFGDLMRLPVGAVPMLTPVYTLPYDGHPGACTQGLAYLIRTQDEVGADDVVARFRLRPNPHDRDPDAPAEFPPPVESGPGVFPITIIEEPDEP
jgi:hypothetical protein